MVWGTTLPSGKQFVCATFGAQYGAQEASPERLRLIDTFHGIISAAADSIECLEEEISPTEGKGFIWMSYWKTKPSYHSWWRQPDTIEFWETLPEDSGFWREVIFGTTTRSQYGTNQPYGKLGFSALGGDLEEGGATGYWHCYRDRMAECKGSRFDTMLASPPVPESQPQPGVVKKGRVRIQKFPDHICWVREGQDLDSMTDQELDHWKQNLDNPASTWIQDVSVAGKEQGVLSMRQTHAAERHPGDKITAKMGNRTQILFFLDIKHMEHLANQNKGHVKLRSMVMQSYCPAGPMKDGKLLLWVEQVVLKSEDVEAEYIGCFEGTGFLAYENHPAFQ